MKHFILFTVSLLLFFSSCSDSVSPEDDSKVTTESLDGLTGEEFFLNLQHYLDIRTNDPLNYTLQSENPEIADAYFIDTYKNKICIKSKEGGVAKIWLLDDKGKNIMLIWVYTQYFGSREIEETYNHPTLQSEVWVDATDPDTKKNIEEELWAKIISKVGTVYTFDKETKKFTMENVESDTKHEGTYEWSIHQLVLKYNNITEVFGFEIDVMQRCNYILTIDNTREYQEKYPDAGITRVKYTRILFDWYVRPL